MFFVHGSRGMTRRRVSLPRTVLGRGRAWGPRGTGRCLRRCRGSLTRARRFGSAPWWLRAAVASRRGGSVPWWLASGLVTGTASGEASGMASGMAMLVCQPQRARLERSETREGPSLALETPVVVAAEEETFWRPRARQDDDVGAREEADASAGRRHAPAGPGVGRRRRAFRPVPRAKWLAHGAKKEKGDEGTDECHHLYCAQARRRSECRALAFKSKLLLAIVRGNNL